MVDPELVEGAPPERVYSPMGLANEVECETYRRIPGVGHGVRRGAGIEPHHLTGPR